MQSIIQRSKQTEQWKDIKGYEGLYQVSNKGRVRSLKKWNVGKGLFEDCITILSPTDNGHGYQIVSLHKDRQRKNHYVHRLVAEAFIENCSNYEVINHIDHNRKNNNVENLEWCTQEYNINYSKHLLRRPKKNAHLPTTGEKYITQRKSTGRYRLIINHKEYGTFKTLEQAVKRRNEILSEVMYPCQCQ